MKRLNPDTNEPYVQGEYRDDGYRFWAYSNNKDKEGYFYLVWREDGKFKKNRQYVAKVATERNKRDDLKSIRNVYTTNRRIAKLKRIPKWLTKEDHDKIKAIYKRANTLTDFTGEKWEVDHIIPLQGKKVSGLHVPSNLRVILKSENASKNNTFMPC